MIVCPCRCRGKVSGRGAAAALVGGISVLAAVVVAVVSTLVVVSKGPECKADAAGFRG